jgi:RNA polymerase sigma-70 factor (ECF subfamily)
MTGMAENIVNYLPQLQRYALALTYNADEAEELVQESLLRALAKCPSWGSIRRPRAYLFSILHNLHVDRRKKAQSEANHLKAMKIGEPSDKTPDPTITYDLARALRRIPSRQRQVIVLIFVEGLTYREAASILGVPAGTVMSRLSRGRTALRRILDGRGARGD